jgi:CRISPR/Cas system-associated exonuclease Cas4 (RecB family)
MGKARETEQRQDAESAIVVVLALFIFVGVAVYSIANNPKLNETIFAVFPSGSIEVTASTSDAYVYVDGVLEGFAPKKISGLSEGKHIVRVWKNGYNEYSAVVEVSVGKTTFLDALLTQFGTISVYSTPSDANVLIDSVLKATTPATVSGIQEGYRIVKVSKKGYADYTKTVFVSANKDTTVDAALEKGGTISVTTLPGGAEVTIDGSLAGKSPVEAGVTAGNHIVKVSLGGYDEYSSSASVVAGETLKLEVALEKQSGSLYINSEPSGATVLVDGVLKGSTPLNIFDVSVGEHSIRISFSGYKEYSATATVSANKTTVVYPGLVKK